MNKVNMNDPDDGAVSRAYAATARDEPPEALDAAILAQARVAVATSAALRRGSRHWGPPLALAATLVVTASLVVLMQHEQPQIVALAPQIVVLAPPAHDAAVAPVAKEQTDAVKAEETRHAEMAQSRGAAVSREQAQSPAHDHAPSQAHNQARSQAPDAAQSRSGPEREPPASSLPRRVDAAQPFAASPDAPAPPRARVAEVPGSIASAAGTVAPSSPARAEAQMQRALIAAPQAAGSAPGAAPAERRSLQGREDVGRNLAAPAAAKKDESPEAWLTRVAELRRLGRIREAEESLAEFRKRYPNFPLPADKTEFPKSNQENK